MLEGKNIICFAPSDWWGMNPSCTTHIMRKLAAKNKILYVNPFSSDLLGMVEKGFGRRVVRKIKSILMFLRQPKNNLYVFSPIFFPFQGNKIIEWSERGLRGTTTDVPEIAEWVVALILAYEPSAVKIDAIGIGAGVYDIVNRLYPKIVHPVLGNAAPEDSKRSRYVNLRAQGYWELRDILKTLYTDKMSVAFLDEIVDLRYKLKGDKILIETKEEMISRIGRSPDYVDAVVYAFLNPDICTDKNDSFYIPYALSTMNESLQKKSIWTPSDTHLPISESKFGVLHA